MHGSDQSVLWRWAAPGALAGTVVAFASGSSSVPQAVEIGRTGRWVALFVLLGAALAYALSRRGASTLAGPALVRFAALPAAFAVLALVSTAWSADPWLTFRRACSLVILFLVAAALAWGSLGDRAAAKRLLGAIVAGAGIVALIGVVLLALSPEYAAQPGTTSTPWRYRGFGENPNTVPLLAAVSIPAAAWLLLETKRAAARAVLALAALLLLATIVASQSRGALLAGCLGLGVIAAVVPRSLGRRVASLAAVAVLLVGGNAIREVAAPSAPPYVSQASPPSVVPEEVAGEPRDQERPPGAAGERPSTAPPAGKPTTPAVPWLPRIVQRDEPEFPLLEGPLPRREDEIGHPHLATDAPFTLGSGRAEAWFWTLDLVRARPLLGYGFGTENIVFVDRLYYFQGGNPENAYLGIVLQLGTAGFLVFGALAGVLLVGAARALRSRGPGAGFVAALLGVVVAGGVAMLVQSYIYSVGNIATVTVWVSAFVLAGEVFGLRRSVEPEVRPTWPTPEVSHLARSA